MRCQRLAYLPLDHKVRFPVPPTLYGPNGYVSAFPGFSVTGALGTGFTVAGSTTITLNIPIVFGTATDITYSLNTFSIVSGSGTQYDRNGVVVAAGPGDPNGVPEPGTLPLFALAFFAIGRVRKLKCQH